MSINFSRVSINFEYHQALFEGSSTHNTRPKSDGGGNSGRFYVYVYIYMVGGFIVPGKNVLFIANCHPIYGLSKNNCVKPPPMMTQYIKIYIYIII